MQAPFDIAADLDTPVSAYMKLASFQPHFLLESVEGGERLARYSFIGFGDGLTVRLYHDRLEVRQGGDSRVTDSPSGSTLLAALRQALSLAPRPRPELPGIPFRGGLVGVSGYDLARRFERLPAPPGRQGAEPEAAYVAPCSLLVFDHVTRRVALLHDGTEEERRALRREVVAALHAPLPFRTHRPRHSHPTPSFSGRDFFAAVERAQAHITAGDVYQLVLAVKFSGTCEVDPFEVYRALRLLNPSPYMYFCSFDGLSVVGSSPEALVRLEGRCALLRPIAGTRPRGTDAESDRAMERELLADPKEAAEHVMLVDLARNDLGRVGVPGTIEVTPFRAVERYSHVMHLVSGVRGVLSPEHDAFDLFAADVSGWHGGRRSQGACDAAHRRHRTAATRSLRRHRGLLRSRRRHGSGDHHPHARLP